jgi:hypothetical protein
VSQDRTGRQPAFWRVLGGALLGLAALGADTVFQRFSGPLSVLRNGPGPLDGDVLAGLHQAGKDERRWVAEELRRLREERERLERRSAEGAIPAVRPAPHQDRAK